MDEKKYEHKRRALALIKEQPDSIMKMDVSQLDEDLIIEAIRQEADLVWDMELQWGRRVVSKRVAKEVIMQSGPIGFLPPEVIDRDLADLMVRRNGSNVRYVPDHILNLQMAVNAISLGGRCFGERFGIIGNVLRRFHRVMLNSAKIAIHFGEESGRDELLEWGSDNVGSVEQTEPKVAIDDQLQTIRNSIGSIGDTEVQRELYEIHKIITKINDELREHPEKQRTLASLFYYYIPTTNRIITKFAELSTIDDETYRRLRDKLLSQLQSSRTYYEKTYRHMFDMDIMALEAEMKVLDQQLRSGG